MEKEDHAHVQFIASLWQLPSYILVWNEEERPSESKKVNWKSSHDRENGVGDDTFASLH